MPIQTVIQTPDSSTYKTKVKLQFLGTDPNGEFNNGSIIAVYVSAVDESDLPAGGTAMEQKIKEQKEFPLSEFFNKYIDPPSLVYVDPEVTPAAKRLGQWLAERNQSQLTSVPATPDTKQMAGGVFKKIVEIFQANGLLPV